MKLCIVVDQSLGKRALLITEYKKMAISRSHHGHFEWALEVVISGLIGHPIVIYSRSNVTSGYSQLYAHSPWLWSYYGWAVDQLKSGIHDSYDRGIRNIPQVILQNKKMPTLRSNTRGNEGIVKQQPKARRWLSNWCSSALLLSACIVFVTVRFSVDIIYFRYT